MAKRSSWERMKRLWINLLVIGLGASVAAGSSYGLRWLGY
jgi:hypothetical protein